MPPAPLNALLAAALAVASTTAQKPPAAPCHSPLNPDFETPCYAVVARGRKSIEVRAYAAGVTVAVDKVYDANLTSALEIGVATFLPYFIGDPPENAAGVQVARTVPITAANISFFWVIGMPLPPSVYPTPATAPASTDTLITLQPLVDAGVPGGHIAAMHFTTPGPDPPTEDEWNAACHTLEGALPSGWVLAPSGYRTLALFTGRDGPFPFQAECWTVVVKGKE
jgi:hypothetical protein